MIEGVIIKKLIVHQDIPDTPERKGEKRGLLMEIVRSDEHLLKKFGQSVFTIAYPPTIKAFHWHRYQDDVWFFAAGRAGIVLHDIRKNSPTYGETQVVYAGEDDYKVIVIPAGVAHGYKVLGERPAFLFYHTTEIYRRENPDEERIPYNDPTIGFQWDSLRDSLSKGGKTYA